MTDKRASREGAPASIALLARRALASPPSPASPADDLVIASEPAAGDIPVMLDKPLLDEPVLHGPATVAATVDGPAAVRATSEETTQVEVAPEETTQVEVAPDGAIALETRRPGPLTVLLAGAAVMALAFAVVSGVVWWRAGHDGATAQAQARDAALVQARLDIATLNTLDYRAVDAGLTQWSAVTAGSLHSQIAQASATEKKIILNSKTVTKAVVLAAAVTSLNLGKGTASVIASVQVTKIPDTGTSVVDRNRVSATLSLVHGTWRLTNLQGVLVHLS
jgi:Mce-associated membrane protein